MSAELLVLRLIHIFGGAFWLGAGIYATYFMVPAIQKIGPAAAPIFAELQRRKLFVVLPTVAILTMLSGLRLLHITSGGFDAAYFHTAMGLTYAISGASALVGFVTALVVGRPAMMRSGQLMAAMGTAGPAEREAMQREMDRLKKRSDLSGQIAMGLILLSGAGMAVARYL